ncbi:HASTY 1-like isoform X1 isoform B [Chlorella sorokiniana]|uniref:HASTY 1-like isoform X1 isoform B n=1 Tax=Chlorella sorokiniana TaxID=3076 RepID=A0A2P6TYB5_CHLSO|nr:HASTY 1-like isoform X1 isoform B [Chlorella sorokiniana]|eukprot:PRW59064.1 HASTY 1-like isoform X1 isoform B [Chlorella sorokiniana]
MDTHSIVQTLLTSQQLAATQQQRLAGLQLHEQLKAGEVHASAAVATELLKLHQPAELQVLGYTLLQHLVGNRWDEFSPEEHSQLATLAYSMLQQGAASWAIRSKASLLLALVIKRTGPELWEAALPQLLQAAQSEGPPMQEQVCMVMRYVADEIAMYSDDIAGDQKRLLLAALTKSLSDVLPFLERMLELNFAAAGAAVQAGNRELAQQHVAVIQAALAAANTYAEWVPVGRLLDAGLINACGFMLNTTEFRDAACDVMRQVAGRKQGDESPEVFRAVLEQIAEALINAAAALLSPAAQAELGYEGQHEAFALTLCETMATLGSQHLAAISKPDRKLAFLQHMLSFAQHPYLLLADKALPMWVKLLQDAAQSVSHAAGSSSSAAAAASAAAAGGAGGSAGSSPRQPTVQLPPECIEALMTMAAEQLQKRGHVPQEDDEFPPYFDTFADFKEMFVQYRARLSSIVRHAAAVLPEQALAAAQRRLDAAVAACSPGSGTKLEDARGLLESAVHFSESTFKAVWDGSIQEQPAKLQAVVAAMEPMLQRLLSLQVSDPMLMQHQARGLESYQKIFGVRKDLAAPAVGRVFDILVNNLPLSEPGQQPPPGKPPPAWREGMHARQFTAMVLLQWTKACPEAFLPHLEALATQVRELWDAGRIRAGEKNALQEAIVGAVTAGPPELQAQVVEWVLAPVRAEWSLPAWQAHLASPEAFIRQYTPVSPDGAGGWQAGGQATRWILYHHAHLVERCIRTMKASVPAGSLQHPLMQHAEWAVPQMLRIVACIHALYTPAGRQALAPIGSALEMAPQERALYLRRGPVGKAAAKPPEDGSGETGDDGYASVGGTTAASLRAWLRHMREFTYQTVGLLPTHCPPVMDSPALAAAYAQSGFAYIDTLEHQHVRIIMRHMIIPHIKNCADRHLQPWLVPGLAQLVPHMHSRLTNAWDSLQAPAGPSSTEDSASANDEIVRERLLRELTQEYALVLKELATRTVGGGSPVAAAAAAAPAAAGAAAAGGSGGGKSVLEWLLETDPTTGFQAVTTAVAGMCWRDDAAFRFAQLAKTLVGVAPRDQRLYAYVGSEVLKAAISSLATETMATHQADIMALIRDILVQQLGDPGSAVHGVLASLPKMTPEALQRFGQQLLGTGSEKTQRDITKKMLVAACGKSSLAALADWKPPAVTPLAEPKHRAPKQGGGHDEHGEAFSAAAVHSLFDR